MTGVAIVLAVALIGFALATMWRGGGGGDRVGPGGVGYDPGGGGDHAGHGHHGGWGGYGVGGGHDGDGGH